MLPLLGGERQVRIMGGKGLDHEESMRTQMQTRRLITAAEVRKRLGKISAITLWRWRQDARLQFPEPIVIRGGLYFDEGELDAWLAAQRWVVTQ